MSRIQTGGVVRGMIARWVFRLEAAGQILRMGFLGVTAASTLTSALALIGYEQFAAYVLVAGITGTFVFAFAYVEFGIFNRKNRERTDRGDNFVSAPWLMGQETRADQLAAAIAAATEADFEDVRRDLRQITYDRYREYRDGIDPDQRPTRARADGGHEITNDR